MDSFVTKSDFIVLRILFADEIEIEANNYLYPVFEPRELVITRKTFILRYWSPTEPDDWMPDYKISNAWLKALNCWEHGTFYFYKHVYHEKHHVPSLWERIVGFSFREFFESDAERLDVFRKTSLADYANEKTDNWQWREYRRLRFVGEEDLRKFWAVKGTKYFQRAYIKYVNDKIVKQAETDAYRSKYACMDKVASSIKSTSAVLLCFIILSWFVFQISSYISSDISSFSFMSGLSPEALSVLTVLIPLFFELFSLVFKWKLLNLLDFWCKIRYTFYGDVLSGRMWSIHSTFFLSFFSGFMYYIFEVSHSVLFSLSPVDLFLDLFSIVVAFLSINAGALLSCGIIVMTSFIYTRHFFPSSGLGPWCVSFYFSWALMVYVMCLPSDFDKFSFLNSLFNLELLPWAWCEIICLSQVFIYLAWLALYFHADILKKEWFAFLSFICEIVFLDYIIFDVLSSYCIYMSWTVPVPVRICSIMFLNLFLFWQSWIFVSVLSYVSAMFSVWVKKRQFRNIIEKLLRSDIRGYAWWKSHCDYPIEKVDTCHLVADETFSAFVHSHLYLHRHSFRYILYIFFLDIIYKAWCAVSPMRYSLRLSFALFFLQVVFLILIIFPPLFLYNIYMYLLEECYFEIVLFAFGAC
jgi:hypothetical protein